MKRVLLLVFLLTSVGYTIAGKNVISISNHTRYSYCLRIEKNEQLVELLFIPAAKSHVFVSLDKEIDPGTYDIKFHTSPRERLSLLWRKIALRNGETKKIDPKIISFIGDLNKDDLFLSIYLSGKFIDLFSHKRDPLAHGENELLPVQH